MHCLQDRMLSGLLGITSYKSSVAKQLCVFYSRIPFLYSIPIPHTVGLSDPEARDQCLLSLLHSLPPVNFKTAVFLFKHLRG